MSGPAKVLRVGSRLVLVGTVHVDPASRSLVKDTVMEVRPEVVGLEIDRERLFGLQNPGLAKPSIAGGPSFLAMALLEKFAGQLTGSSPGLEMLEAVGAARTIGARVELIDRPIGITVAGLKRLPLGEKLRIGVDGVASLVFLPFGKADFSQLMDDIDNQLQIFRSRYPNLSRLLLDDREEYMAERIRRVLDETVGQVVVVVGFGHLRNIARRVEGYREGTGYSSRLTWTLGTG